MLNRVRKIFNMDKRKNKFTVKDKLRVVRLQYICEFYIEKYQEATSESDKYFVKIEFLSTIEKEGYIISAALQYMMLQEEKFKPFIILLEDLDKDKEPVQQKVRQEGPVHEQPCAFVIRIGG